MSVRLSAAPVEGFLPGNRGIWAGILSEMTEFALLFAVYFIARAHFPESFHGGPPRLNTFAGTFNTLLMISGSYCVANAVLTSRADRRRATAWWLIGVLACALGYMVTKYFELRWNSEHGINGEAGIFFTVYYYLTFTHMVHVLWGIMGIVWVSGRNAMGAYSSSDGEGLEAFACYWHATDLAWLVIFPLVYLLR